MGRENAKTLQRYEINSIIWDRILLEFESLLTYVDDETNIYSLFYGTANKSKIYFNNEWMVIQAYKFNYIYKLLYNEDIIDECTNWKQIVLRLNDDIAKPTKTINGSYAFNYIYKNILLKEYTDQEIDDIFHAHEAEKDKKLIQRHDTLALRYNIYKIDNCVKYDITKAHASIIIKMFPKCEKRIKAILAKAKKLKKEGKLDEARIYKDYINFFVGFLAHKTEKQKVGKYEKTYNYIVQQITKKLMEAENILIDNSDIDNMLIYTNTDSICVKNPKKLLQETSEIGEFKLEYIGTVYFYRNDHYFIYQFGDELVGSCRRVVRDKFDLKNGKVVNYTTRKINHRMEIENICIEKVNVVEL